MCVHEQDSPPSDHHEPTSSLATLWAKKRLLSCRPLRVRSLLVGSIVRHLGTPCVRESACAFCLSSVFTKVSSEEFRSSINLDERSLSSKFFHPTGFFEKVSSCRMRLHPFESSGGIIRRSVARVMSVARNQPQRNPDPGATHGIRLPGISHSRLLPAKLRKENIIKRHHASLSRIFLTESDHGDHQINSSHF